ncbi:hypothetical protein [Pantanalinema sp. GBBB05]|uniref:hypothetical protein n=1 Tax=Pantanalinema sp. GBBB05 TaxID=2604139 RepID=UPI001DA1038A|nr:hypothetical protein [Pantanalinema sp. GBBB05]
MVTHPQQTKRQGLELLVTGAIAIVALAGVILMQRSQLNRPSLWVTDAKQAEAQEAMNLKLLKQAPALGFDNLLADWTFLNFLQYYGDTPVRTQTGYGLSPQYFDLITQRDPRFVDIYLFLSGTLSYQLGKPELAIEYMTRGTNALSPAIDPTAFQVWRFKGLDQLLLLGDVPGSIYSHDMAARWVRETSDQAWQTAGLPPKSEVLLLYEATANFLRQDPNSVLVRFYSWSSIYDQAVAVKDKQTQDRAKREIIALGGQVKTENGQVSFIPPKIDLKSPPKPKQ